MLKTIRNENKLHPTYLSNFQVVTQNKHIIF